MLWPNVLPKNEPICVLIVGCCEQTSFHSWFSSFLPLGFDNASLSKSVLERSTLNAETLTVKRRFGLRGGSRVHWEARLDGVLANDDIEPVQGDLVFAQGEDTKTINFNVKPDSTPEILEVSDHIKYSTCTFLICLLLGQFSNEEECNHLTCKRVVQPWLNDPSVLIQHLPSLSFFFDKPKES